MIRCVLALSGGYLACSSPAAILTYFRAALLSSLFGNSGFVSLVFWLLTASLLFLSLTLL